MECRPPDSTVHGILQSGILEWVAISFSRASSQQSRDPTHVSSIAGGFWLSHQGSPYYIHIHKYIYIYIYTHIHIYINAGDIRDAGLIPKLGWPPGAGHDNPLWYSCLGNPTETRAIYIYIICLSHYLLHQVSTCIPILLTLMVCLILFP